MQKFCFRIRLTSSASTMNKPTLTWLLLLSISASHSNALFLNDWIGRFRVLHGANNPPQCRLPGAAAFRCEQESSASDSRIMRCLPKNIRGQTNIFSNKRLAIVPNVLNGVSTLFRKILRVGATHSGPCHSEAGAFAWKVDQSTIF